MKQCRSICAALLANLLASAITFGSDSDSGKDGENSNVEVVQDAPGDAVIRRTDIGNDGAIGVDATLPDLLAIRMGAWQPDQAATDPYTGHWCEPDGASIFRVDVVFSGLVNPPGPLGLGSNTFNPFMFGPNPVYGFTEFDVDRSLNTGGECDGAEVRYLANVARFGEVPNGTLSSRIARSADDYNASYSHVPQYRRSGAEFSIVLCGCFNVTIVDHGGDSDGVFGHGDTWIVRGRFFQRAGGLAEGSAAFGGSAAQMYDPWVKLRFQHSIADDTTTMSLVYALTMKGAGQLAGQPTQPIDNNVGNHTSIEEALDDVIKGAKKAVSPCGVGLAAGWDNRDPKDYLDVTRWRKFAIVGTSYANPEDSLYVYTDVAGRQNFGDCDGNGVVNAADRNKTEHELDDIDGSQTDCDHTADGSFTICNFGPNFSLSDLNYNGVVDAIDISLLSPRFPGDANGDCHVNGADLSVLLGQFGMQVPPSRGADFNNDAVVNGADLSVLLGRFGQDCPGNGPGDGNGGDDDDDDEDDDN